VIKAVFRPRKGGRRAVKNLRRNKSLVVWVCLCLIAVTVLSFAYLLETAGHSHHCADEHCPVCLHIAGVQNLLRRLGMGVAPAALLPVCFSLFPAVFGGRTGCAMGTSPVALKVKLNN
jgi:hypothetical protein